MPVPRLPAKAVNVHAVAAEAAEAGAEAAGAPERDPGEVASA